MKQTTKLPISREELDALPSSIERFRGILSEENADLDWKKSRDEYLDEKYRVGMQNIELSTEERI